MRTLILPMFFLLCFLTVRAQLPYTNVTGDSLIAARHITEIVVHLDSAVEGYTMETRDTNLLQVRRFDSLGREFFEREIFADVYYVWYQYERFYDEQGLCTLLIRTSKPERTPGDMPSFMQDANVEHTWYIYRDTLLYLQYQYRMSGVDSVLEQTQKYLYDQQGRDSVSYVVGSNFPFRQTPYERYHYASNGKPDTAYSWRDSRQAWEPGQIYTFDGQGQKSSWSRISTGWDGQTYELTYRYEYDDRGNVVKRTRWQNGKLDDFETYRYNEHNLLVEENAFDGDGSFQYRFVTTYRYADE